MAIWTAHLAVWLLGLGALITAAVVPLSRLIRHDSTRYDEVYVWQRKLDGPPREDK
ncbi:hypothetical protein [Paenibacillus humicus]|uniref:hypothetical protein n=1 Tax=Paenibacillus humicus TaxID=412861 RepID=UPI003F15C67D